jgi:hypothetical protein
MEASEFTAMTSTSFFSYTVREPGHREPDLLQVVSTGPVAYRLQLSPHQASQPAQRRVAPTYSVAAGPPLRVGIAQNPAQFGSKGFVL